MTLVNNDYIGPNARAFSVREIHGWHKLDVKTFCVFIKNLHLIFIPKPQPFFFGRQEIESTMCSHSH